VTLYLDWPWHWVATITWLREIHWELEASITWECLIESFEIIEKANSFILGYLRVIALIESATRCWQWRARCSLGRVLSWLESWDYFIACIVTYESYWTSYMTVSWVLWAGGWLLRDLVGVEDSRFAFCGPRLGDDLGLLNFWDLERVKVSLAVWWGSEATNGCHWIRLTHTAYSRDFPVLKWVIQVDFQQIFLQFYNVHTLGFLLY